MPTQWECPSKDDIKPFLWLLDHAGSLDLLGCAGRHNDMGQEEEG